MYFQKSVFVGIATNLKWMFFCIESRLKSNILMKLMMYLGNDLIEAVPLDQERIPKPGYLGSFKRSLKEKYKEMIMQFSEPPEFLVINLQHAQ
jgi:hypothetical protein